MAVNGIPFTLPVEPALTADIVAATGGRALPAASDRPRDRAARWGYLPRAGAAGLGNAMRFMLTAEVSGAAEAVRIGPAQEVVPARGGRHPGHRAG